jgi:hypothetical protein
MKTIKKILNFFKNKNKEKKKVKVFNPIIPKDVNVKALIIILERLRRELIEDFERVEVYLCIRFRRQVFISEFSHMSHNVIHLNINEYFNILHYEPFPFDYILPSDSEFKPLTIKKRNAKRLEFLDALILNLQINEAKQ